MTRLSIGLIVAAAIAAALVVIGIGTRVLSPARALITRAAFAPEAITPNADGADDITVFRYGLSRNAAVSLIFETEAGESFAFRRDQARAAGDYSAEFSGVVDGYVRAGETIAGETLRRLMPDGVYTWRLQAVAEDGEMGESTGILTLSEGDAPLPELVEFSVFPAAFTPNQDGVSDRTGINIYLSKAAALDVYLLAADGVTRLTIPARLQETRDGEAGRYLYDYDGGVDRGADPPPDGDYTVVAEAQDAVGQRVRRTAPLTIIDGGKPLAEIVGQPNGVTVAFSRAPYDDRYASTRAALGEVIAMPDDAVSLNLETIRIPVGDLLVFKLTVENYTDIPIRTAGPPLGTVYQWDQRASSLGEFEEAGAWRVGIDCTTADSDYPWRWAIAADEALIEQTDPATGRVYTFLPPGARSMVWGAVRMTTIELFNPQNCWAGLIQEQVETSVRNNVVGARQIELIAP